MKTKEKVNNLEIIRKACIKARDDKFYNYGDYSQIHLSDVLMAIKEFYNWDYNFYFNVNTSNFQIVTKDDTTVMEESFWDLTKTLELQPPETLNFLAELLK